MSWLPTLSGTALLWASLAPDGASLRWVTTALLFLIHWRSCLRQRHPLTTPSLPAMRANRRKRQPPLHIFSPQLVGASSAGSTHPFTPSPPTGRAHPPQEATISPHLLPQLLRRTSAGGSHPPHLLTPGWSGAPSAGGSPKVLAEAGGCELGGMWVVGWVCSSLKPLEDAGT